MRIAVVEDTSTTWLYSEDYGFYMVREVSGGGKCLAIRRSWLNDVSSREIIRLCILPVRDSDMPGGEVLAVVDAPSVDEVLERIVGLATTTPVDAFLDTGLEEIARVITRREVRGHEEAVKEITGLLRRLGIRVEEWVLHSPPINMYKDIIRISLSKNRDTGILWLTGYAWGVLFLGSRRDTERAKTVLQWLSTYARMKMAEKDLLEQLGRKKGEQVLKTVSRLLRRLYYGLRERLVYATISHRAWVEQFYYVYETVCRDSICFTVYLRNGRLGVTIGNQSYEERIPQPLYDQLSNTLGTLTEYITHHVLTRAISELVEDRNRSDPLLLIPVYWLPRELKTMLVRIGKVLRIGGKQVVALRASTLERLVWGDELGTHIRFMGVALHGDRAEPVDIHVYAYVIEPGHAETEVIVEKTLSRKINEPLKKRRAIQA